MQAQPGKVFRDTAATRRLQIERQQIEIGALQQVRRLAARGRAGVEHPAAGRRVEQGGSHLRRRILNRNEAFGKAWQAIDRQWPVEHQARLAKWRRADAFGAQARLIFRGRAAPAIDAQRHRRRLIAGGDDAGPQRRISRLQTVQPPVRVLAGGDRIGRQFGKQLRLLAQIVAQDAIDQPPEAPFGQFPGRRNGLIDDGMRCIGPGFQPVQRDQQQGTHLGRIQRPGKQPAKEEITASVSTQTAIDEILHRRTGHRVNATEQAIGQALPGEHRGIDAGSLQEGESQRI